MSRYFEAEIKDVPAGTGSSKWLDTRGMTDAYAEIGGSFAGTIELIGSNDKVQETTIGSGSSQGDRVAFDRLYRHVRVQVTVFTSGAPTVTVYGIRHEA